MLFIFVKHPQRTGEGIGAVVTIVRVAVSSHVGLGTEPRSFTKTLRTEPSL